MHHILKEEACSRAMLNQSIATNSTKKETFKIAFFHYFHKLFFPEILDYICRGKKLDLSFKSGRQ